VRFGFRLLCSDSKDGCKPLLFERNNPVSATIRRCSQRARLEFEDAKQVMQARRRLETQQLLEWHQADTGIWQFESAQALRGPLRLPLP